MVERTIRTSLRSLPFVLALGFAAGCEEIPPPAVPSSAPPRRAASIERSGITGCAPLDQPAEDGLLVSYEHRFEGAGGEHWKLLVKPDGELSLYEWEMARKAADGSVEVACFPDAKPKVLGAGADALVKLRSLLDNPRLKNLDTKYIGASTGDYAVFRLTMYRGAETQVIDAGPVDWSNLPKELGDVVDELRALRARISPEG